MMPAAVAVRATATNANAMTRRWGSERKEPSFDMYAILSLMRLLAIQETPAVRGAIAARQTFARADRYGSASPAPTTISSHASSRATCSSRRARHTSGRARCRGKAWRRERARSPLLPLRALDRLQILERQLAALDQMRHYRLRRPAEEIEQLIDHAPVGRLLR